MNYDSYGMKPFTLEERLERIQAEILKFGDDYIPKTQTMAALYAELLRRQDVLRQEIKAKNEPAPA